MVKKDKKQTKREVRKFAVALYAEFNQNGERKYSYQKIATMIEEEFNVEVAWNTIRNWVHSEYPDEDIVKMKTLAKVKQEQRNEEQEQRNNENESKQMLSMQKARPAQVNCTACGKFSQYITPTVIQL